ncbi:hypothetical protein L210DRAFT_949567 [Boletus edulis BED1]|uniref:Uncharacterized protein n=1 Tax=Boletus edulis BED1 TaxID=1328754 RepID=A0AAD4GLW8_BOLED|nr:hypothetical protein L210DRAFT_949567 [Boletus edulis BED1]
MMAYDVKMEEYYTLLYKRTLLEALSRNEARVKRQSNVFGQARESGAARLSFAPPPALAHRVAQLALEFSPTHRTLVVLPGGRTPPRFPLGSIEPWRGVRGVPTHPRSSPSAQDSSWSRTARRAAARPHSHSVTLSPSSPSRSPLATAHERCPKKVSLSFFVTVWQQNPGLRIISVEQESTTTRK